MGKSRKELELEIARLKDKLRRANWNLSIMKTMLESNGFKVNGKLKLTNN